MFFDAVRRLWTKIQVELPKITRWGSFLKDHPEIRKQDTLQHSFGFALFGIIAIAVIEDRRQGKKKLDAFLLLACIILHDFGELRHIKEGEDKPFTEKTNVDDVEEYEVFATLIEEMPSAVQIVMKKAFLLQFCLKDNAEINEFPEEAKDMLLWLKTNHLVEATIFAALEQLDYILFGKEQYTERGVKGLLAKLFEKHPGIVKDLCTKNGVPEILDTIWTPEYQAEAEVFVAGYNEWKKAGGQE